jgi:membrane-associated phospholipid phosphatase
MNRGYAVYGIKNIANTFIKQKLTPFTKALYLFVALNALIGVILLIVNHFTYHYTGNLWYGPIWQRATLPLIGLSIFLVYFQDIISDRLRLVMYVFVFYCLSLLAGLILTQGVQLTPFPTIDHWLLHVDQALGFNQNHLINFAYAHSTLHSLLVTAYDSVTWQLVLLPFIMALLLCERSVKVFLLAMLISYPVGLLIYYFFPATAPASMLHNSNLISMQHDTYIKFYQIHHYLKITTVAGGLVVVPSFHIIWAVLLTYLTRNKKWIFYPLLVWNIILACSTVSLGWHYLVDVTAGIVVAGIAIIAAEMIFQRTLAHCHDTKNFNAKGFNAKTQRSRKGPKEDSRKSEKLSGLPN